MRYSLESLLAPLSPKVFLRDYWEAKHFVLRREHPGFYRELFSLDSMDELLAASQRKISHPQIVVKDGAQLLDPERYCLSEAGASNSWIEVDKVIRAYGEGRTVVLSRLQHLWAPVNRLVRSLERRLRLRVNANLYLTPPGSEGKNLHYDNHGFFILQVTGSKIWKFYEASLEMPIFGQEDDFPPEGLKPTTRLLEEVELRDGDLLYLPRGLPHETQTHGEPSMHVTIGLDGASRSGWAFLHAVLRRLERECPEISLPMPRSARERRAQFREWIERLGGVGAEEALAAVRRETPFCHPPPRWSLAEADRAYLKPAQAKRRKSAR